MKIKVLTIIGLIFFCSKIFSQDSYQILIDKFFDDYKNIGAEKAIDNIYKTNKWSYKVEDALSNLKKEFASYNKELVGNYYGCDSIVEKRLTDCFVLKSYLLRYERQPLRLTFEFYKPNDKWYIYSVNIDTNYDDELEEAAKVYQLR